MDKRTLLLAYGLVLIGILARLLPHPPNVTPLVAVALFSGAYLPRRLGLVVPLVIMMLSDLVIGFEPQVLFGWLAFVVVAVMGFSVRKRHSVARLAATSLAASTLFFLLSNFGVWCEARLYAMTLGGLRDCYIAAVPFYRNMLLGDLAFVAALFGGWAWVRTWARAPAIESSR